MSSKFDPHPVSIKLADDNYLPWRQQAMATIRGYKLQGFISGAPVIPPKFLSAADEASGTLNEAFLQWDQQDQLLMSWLLASMSDGMLVRMVGCDYSFQIWEKLEVFFASQTKAKVNQLQTQLRSLKKGTMIASDYLLKVKRIVDSLSAVGSPISVSDHIDAILDGLSEDYNGFVVSITSRTDPYSVNEIEHLLMAQEERIEKYRKEASTSLSANVAQTGASKASKPPSLVPASGQRAPMSPQGGRSMPYRGGGRGGRFRGGGRANGNRPQCQVCGRFGHMAWQCFHRFNHQFVSPFSQSLNQFSSPFSSTPRMNNTPAPSTSVHQPMQALLASPDGHFDASWYPDSGASNHITSNLSNIGSPSEYHGNDCIYMADGTGITINHIGKTKMLSSNPSRPLYLNNLLHVPFARKNLISVSQFASDNGVFFELLC